MIYPRLHLDKETRSVKELGKSTKNVGLYRYAADATTSIWMFSYRFEFTFGQYGPVKRWWRDEPLPQEVVDHIALGLPLLGHNVTFERTIWNAVLPRQSNGLDLPQMSIAQTDCTMARARAIGLPGDLERAAEVVNAPVQKNKAGSEIMRKMSKPRAVAFDNEAAGRAYHDGKIPWIEVMHDGLAESRYCLGYTGVMTVTWWYDTTLRGQLGDYCDDDVYAECGVDLVVPALSPSERETWELDQKINDRGVMIDKPFVEGVVRLIEKAVARANREMWTLTDGAVKKCVDHGAVRKWLNARWPMMEGETPLVESVAKGETEALVLEAAARKDTLAQQVIELHNAAAGGTSKFQKALDVIGEDWRARGQFSYHVANATGRWAGQGIQLQNLLRVDEERELPQLRVIIDIIEHFDTVAAFDLIGAL